MWKKKIVTLVTWRNLGQKPKRCQLLEKVWAHRFVLAKSQKRLEKRSHPLTQIHTERNRDKLTTPHLLKKIKPGNSYLFENGYNVTHNWFINIHEYRLRGQRKIKWRILTLKTVPRGLPWAWRVLGKNSTFQKENQGLVRRGWWRRRLPRTPFSCLFMY